MGSNEWGYVNTPEALRARVERYREMASRIDDKNVRGALLELAEKFERLAAEIDGAGEAR
jgi:hypothetical protein